MGHRGCHIQYALVHSQRGCDVRPVLVTRGGAPYLATDDTNRPACGLYGESKFGWLVAGSPLGTPQRGQIIRHPPRMREEPSVVAYKTLNTPWASGPTLSPGVALTLHPMGAWIGVTRFELSYARTPRFWLVSVDAIPAQAVRPGELPLQEGQTFFLEWRGASREWVRRPRFPGDIEKLGGFSIIPPAEYPQPPTPPERYGHRRHTGGPSNATSSSSTARSSASWNNGGSTTPASPERQTTGVPPSSTTGTLQPHGHRVIPSKARPPLPPTEQRPGSESETSWPSEDEPLPTTSTSTSASTTSGRHGDMDPDEQPLDATWLMQSSQAATRPPATVPVRDSQPRSGDSSTAWIPEPAPQTPVDLLQALTQVIHELLQASFSQPNEMVTTLAYRACNYITERIWGSPWTPLRQFSHWTTPS